MPKPALIIDDNANYVDMLLHHFEPVGFEFDHAWNATEGYQTLQDVGSGYYGLIITDITMEGQTSGLKLIRRMRKYGYKGVIMVASTGFNSRFVREISRRVLKWWGVDLIVPKAPLKEGDFHFLGISRRGVEFAHMLRAHLQKK